MDKGIEQFESSIQMNRKYILIKKKVKSKINQLKILIRKKYFKESLEKPIFLFCYHKSGTKLLDSIFRELSEKFGWSYVLLAGYRESIPLNKDIVLFCHSQVSPSIINFEYNGLHIIRDPRDIVISGYFYHNRTTEEWCVNKKFIADDNKIIYPMVPKSQEHKSEKWKRDYLHSLNSMSYQDNLNSLHQNEGIDFEMDRYASWTIEAMDDWNYNKSNIIEMKFERIINEYDKSFKDIFDHFKFSDRQIMKALKVAKRHDINRKKTDEIKRHPHISGIKVIGKWEDYFTDYHKKKFKEKFGDILIKLGYEGSNDW